MATTDRTPLNLDALVEHMFDQVLSPAERSELLVWITRWEAANPDADPAHRVTGWIDVAYAFQAHAGMPQGGRDAVRAAGWLSDGLAVRFA